MRTALAKTSSVCFRSASEARSFVFAQRSEKSSTVQAGVVMEKSSTVQAGAVTALRNLSHS